MAKTDQSKVAYAFTLAAGSAAALGGATTYQSSKATHIPVMPAKAASGTEGVMSYDERLIEAKLEAVEARTETKFAQLLGEIRALAISLTHLSTDIGIVRGEVQEAKTAAATGKTYVIGTGIALGAFIIAVFAFGWQILDAASGLFQAGASK